MQIVKDYVENVGIGEIPQQVEVKFAYCIRDGDTISQKNQWVKCRDFLGDVIWVDKYKQPLCCYEFKVAADKQYLSTQATELLLLVKSKEYYKNILEFTPWLHDIEAKNGLELTTIYPVNTTHLYVCGDKFWTTTIFNISLYSFLIKLLATKTEALPDTNESSYIKQVGNRLDFILNNLQQIKQNTEGVSGWYDEANRSWSILHNSSGFCSLIKPCYRDNSISKFINEATKCAA